jgi:hypothetical protein
MTRGLVLATFMVMTLMVTRTSGQNPYSPIMDHPVDRGHWDRAAVPLEQAADVIVVLVPDETFDLHIPTPHERVIRGSIVRLDKGPMPPMIVHTPNTFVTPLQAKVPAKLFLTKFKDRDASFIIGVHPQVPGEKP